MDWIYLDIQRLGNGHEIIPSQKSINFAFAWDKTIDDKLIAISNDELIYSLFGLLIHMMHNVISEAFF